MKFVGTWMDLENVSWDSQGLERHILCIRSNMQVLAFKFYICIFLLKWVCVDAKKVQKDHERWKGRTVGRVRRFMRLQMEGG